MSDCFDISACVSAPVRVNMLHILRFLRSCENSTAQEISQGLSIPIATTYRLLHRMMDAKIICSCTKSEVVTGRRPIVYHINPYYAFAVCITIEKTSVCCSLTNLHGVVSRSQRFPLCPEWDLEKFLEETHRSLNRLLCPSKSTCEAIKIRFIYIAVEADVDTAYGKILQFSGANFLDDFNIVSHFSSKYGVATRLIKLLHIEAMAGIFHYYRHSFDNYIYLHIGVGFGASIIIDGKIYLGARGKAGELIRLTTKDGCSWEDAYSTNNLYKRLISISERKGTTLNVLMSNGCIPSPTQSQMPLMSILDMAIDLGCKEAKRILDEVAYGWADAILKLHAVFDPEVIVVGGDVSSEVPHVFSALREHLTSRSFDGKILPAQYESSLQDAIARNAQGFLFDCIDNDFRSDGGKNEASTFLNKFH